MNIVPTRMELSKFQKRLKTSREAYKLLKDMQDELMKRFIDMLREMSEIREQVNSSIKTFSTQAGLSVASFPHGMVENLFLVNETLVTADIRQKNWMGVPITEIAFKTKEAKPSSALISSPLLTKTEQGMRETLPLLLRLTELEKNCYILSDEIESLRRRVNALEHMIIPGLIKNIKVIQMKLSDGERDRVTRLIKFKGVE